MTPPRTRRVTVVVGGTSGIGLAAAVAAAGKGDQLVLVARDGAAFAAARTTVDAAGEGDTHSIAADVRSADDLDEMVAEVLDRYGRIDAVVHTAAVMAYGTLEAMPADTFETVVDTAIHGTANLARAVLPVMREQKRGVFVIVNSLLGSITVPTMGAYTTSKWGQRAVARTLQQELRFQRGVRVCIVSPGSINTPIYYQAASVVGREARPPVPVLQPQVAGRVIARLLDRPRNHVSIPVGPVNPIAILGYRFLPAVYDLIVWPLFRVAGLTSRQDRTGGNLHAPEPTRERTHGHWPAAAD